jgi:hypothetical protein
MGETLQTTKEPKLLIHTRGGEAFLSTQLEMESVKSQDRDQAENPAYIPE